MYNPDISHLLDNINNMDLGKCEEQLRYICYLRDQEPQPDVKEAYKMYISEFEKRIELLKSENKA